MCLTAGRVWRVAPQRAMDTDDRQGPENRQPADNGAGGDGGRRGRCGPRGHAGVAGAARSAGLSMRVMRRMSRETVVSITASWMYARHRSSSPMNGAAPGYPPKKMNVSRSHPKDTHLRKRLTVVATRPRLESGPIQERARHDV